MAKAVKITTTGERSVEEFNKTVSYSVLREAVGGLIECINLPDQQTCLWLNEEGKLIGLDQNPIATKLWVDNYGYNDVIVGDVIITGGNDEEGYTLGLTDEQVDYYLNLTEGLRYAGNIEDTIRVSVSSAE